MEFERLPDETELELLLRVVSEKKKNGMTWDQVASIMNNLTGNNFGESAWRKRVAKTNSGICENLCKNETFTEDCKNTENDIDEKIRELERLKIQYRDERNAWNKQNYIDARTEQKLDYLSERLSEISRINFPTHDLPGVNSENEMIILLTDWHIGQCFNSICGEYNTDIATKRINQLLYEVKKYASLFQVGRAHIVCAGDMLSGSIHKTVQITNRENVIEQIKFATELITSFCYECTKIFGRVFLYSVVGNHSRIDKKEDSLHDERLDDLIGWATNLSLSHLENFKYMNHRNLDSGICDISICGKSYIAVHGDFDAASKQGTSNLSMMLGFVPEAILRGHLHTPSYNEYNGVKVIQGGSLCGSGDQYTLEKRLFGKPSQTICICNKKGMTVHIPIELN